MTVPDGEIIAELTVDTDAKQISRDIHRTLDRVDKDTDKDTRTLGRHISQEIGEGMRDSDRFIIDAFSAIMDVLDRDRSGGGTRRFRRTGRRIASEIADGLTSNSGVFRKAFESLQGVIGPLIGPIFNVSGRSPVLFLLLVPLLGALVALIVGAIQGLQALVALLYLIPNLLFAIGLQGLALVAIFNGLFQAIAAVGQAKNLQELDTLLKGLNPEMAKFVKTLFGWKEIFRELSEGAKTQFFSRLGDVMLQLQKALGPTLIVEIGKISAALGYMFATILGFFKNPIFVSFTQKIASETTYWIARFGESFAVLLDGITKFGAATLPFLRWFGEAFNGWIASIGRWFERLSQDPGFFDWLDRAKVTMGIFLDTLGAIWGALKQIVKNIDEMGGDELLKQLRDGFNILKQVFASDIGKKAMVTFLTLLKAFFVFTFLLIVGITAALGVIYYIFNSIKYILTGIVDFFRLIWFGLEFLGKKFLDWRIRFTAAVIGWFLSVVDTVKRLPFVQDLITLFNKVKDFLTDLKGKAEREGWFTAIIEAFKELGHKLVQALINAINEKAEDVRIAIYNLFAKAGPAGRFAGGLFLDVTGGPLQPTTSNPDIKTTTYTLIKGGASQNQSLGAGSNTANTTNVAAGAVQVNYSSTYPPTQQQAQNIGAGIANGMSQQLAYNSTRVM